jgi:hypothetical protein
MVTRSEMVNMSEESLRARSANLTKLVQLLMHDIEVADEEIKMIYRILYNRRRTEFLDEFAKDEDKNLARTYTQIPRQAL